ncbi:MAG: oligosaccharide flippase family protein [Ignavibacteriae bacterium]|nr:oligosaccharide flippase family protein [Ignavibacteriota bacterium]
MKVQEHLGKISWSIADKFLYILYGLVMIIQIKYIDPKEFGLYGLLINLHTWIFIVADAYLTNLIQFGMNKDNVRLVNTYSIFVHIIIAFGASLVFFTIQTPLSNVFNEPRIKEIANYLPLLCLVFIPRTFCVKLLLRDHKMQKLFWVDVGFFGTMAILTVYYIYTYHLLNFNLMLVIYFAGSIISTLISILLTLGSLEFGFSGGIKLKKLLSFGFPLMLTSAFNALPKQLDIYMVQFFFSTSVVGIYYSAKTLFRFFEETASAAISLVYPAAVRALESKNYKGLNDLMTKATSFVFISFLIIIIPLELGLSKLLIEWFLPVRYHLAVTHFNVLMIASIGLPFVILSTIINASQKPYTVLLYVIISLVLSFITYYFVGLSGNQYLIPVGVIVYLISLGILCFIYVNKQYNFRVSQIFRAVGDSYNYLKGK